jgi:hypothetical protein
MPIVPAPASVAVAPGPRPTSAKLRANFSLDPDDTFVLGIIRVSRDRDFVPTKQLWREWRARRAERKTTRERQRAARRETASR